MKNILYILFVLACILLLIYIINPSKQLFTYKTCTNIPCQVEVGNFYMINEKTNCTPPTTTKWIYGNSALWINTSIPSKVTTNNQTIANQINIYNLTNLSYTIIDISTLPTNHTYVVNVDWTLQDNAVLKEPFLLTISGYSGHVQNQTLTFPTNSIQLPLFQNQVNYNVGGNTYFFKMSGLFLLNENDNINCIAICMNNNGSNHDGFINRIATKQLSNVLFRVSIIQL